MAPAAPAAQPVAPRPLPESMEVPMSSGATNNTQRPPGGGNGHRPVIAASKRSESSAVFGKEVQRLQKLIEAKMADLAEEPNSRVLRRDLRRLQDRLNSILNKAITASKKQHQRQSSLSSFSNFSQSVYDQEIANSNKYQNLEAHQAVPAACSSEEDLDSLTVNRHRNHKNKHGEARSDQGREVSPSKQVSDDEKPRGRRPEPRASRESVVPSGTGLVSRDSSYCPSRNTGSSERRAERKSSGHFSTERSPHKKESKMPRNYQAPYVEDSISTPRVEVESPSPVTSRKEKDKKLGNKVCEPWKNLPPDFVLKSALASERSSSDGSRKSRHEASKESPRPREKSLESDRSDPSSSKSSGSKTVRFKQSVDIRTALPFDGDAEAEGSDSDSETPACLRSPGSPLISRKKYTFRSGSYDGGGPDKYLHPHYGQYSKRGAGAHGEHLHMPDSFQAGTPAKGYSQGAFSKEFDHGEDWDAFRSPQYSHAEYLSDDNSFRGYYEAKEEYQASTPRAYNYGHHGQYMESTASLPSRLSSGSIFSSFFKKSKDKTSSAPPINRASSYTPDHDFHETARGN
ncbi:hypothetical protein ACHAPI_000859 [Fusarium lateritium]